MEKLVELLGRVQQMGVIYKENQMDERYPTIEQIRNTEVAARLIANGVTVQEWVSVEDELPEDQEEVLVCTRSKNGIRNIDKGYMAIDHFIHRGRAEVTQTLTL